MRSRQLGLTLALLAGGVIGCGSEAAPPAPTGNEGGPNILFVVSDTLRADAIDCDLLRERTPNICSIADRGALFENSYAGGPWTLPSSVSLFSGNHATSYGQVPPTAAGEWSVRDEFFRIADDEELLAETLAARGYDTLRFNESKLPGQANVFQGLIQPPLRRQALFKALRRDYPPAREWKSASLPLHDLGLLKYLARGPENPFFLFLWIVNPHAPYKPVAADQRAAAEGLELRFEVPFYAQLGHLNKPEEGHHELRTYAPYSEDEVEMLVGLYHAEVRAVDRRIGRFLELLEARGLTEDTIIVITSDHGEGFGEHERFLHGNSFYEELLHVPLIMAGPGISNGVRVTARVPNIDVMPTLCDLTGAGCMQNVEGRSLRPLFEGDAPEARPLYATAPMRHGLLDAVIDGDYKLILSNRGIELYDLANDPEERTDLAEERPEVVERLKVHLRDLRRRNEVRRKQNQELISDEGREQTKEGTMEQLRALGYIE